MGAAVELVAYTCCEGLDSSNPETRCAGISSADIQVFFDGQSLLFDFSNVQASGAIANAGFEGYVLSTSDDSRMSEIVDASVDLDVSSVSAEEVVVEVDENHVAVAEPEFLRSREPTVTTATGDPCACPFVRYPFLGSSWP